MGVNKGEHRSPSTEIQSGQRLSPSTEFKSGHVSWNTGTAVDTKSVCESCGKPFVRYSKRSGSFKYCSHECAYSERGGSKHPMWKPASVRKLSTQGYKMGEFKKLAHREVVEKAIGRTLRKGELVHHINGNKQDNRRSNLLVCSNSYHRWLHNRMSLLYQMKHFDPMPNSGG